MNTRQDQRNCCEERKCPGSCPEAPDLTLSKTSARPEAAVPSSKGGSPIARSVSPPRAVLMYASVANNLDRHQMRNGRLRRSKTLLRRDKRISRILHQPYVHLLVPPETGLLMVIDSTCSARFSLSCTAIKMERSPFCEGHTCRERDCERYTTSPPYCTLREFSQ